MEDKKIFDRQIRITESLSELFSNVGVINYKEDSFELVKGSQRFNVALEGITTASEAAKCLVDEFIREDYLNEVREFLNLDKILAALETKPSVSIEYVEKKKGWSRLTFINLRDSDCELIGIVQIIDQEKKRALNLLSEYRHATTRVLAGARTGLWSIEFDGDNPPRMRTDETMCELIGVDYGTSPETTYQIWISNVVPEYLKTTQEAVQNILSCGRAEVNYPYMHPQKGLMHVRCGGVVEEKIDDAHFSISGYHQDITETMVTLQSMKEQEEEQKLAYKKETQRVAKEVKEKTEVQRQLKMSETMIECIRILTCNMDSEEAIANFLSRVGDYYMADRAYIFSNDYDMRVVRNTYEWCRAGVTPQIETLTNVSFETIDRWLGNFSVGKSIFIQNLETTLSHDNPEYQLLTKQSITSLIAVPFIKDNLVVGFMGVDNPKRYKNSDVLLYALSPFALEILSQKQQTERLYQLSYNDQLTGTLNRRAYNEDMVKMNESGEKNVGVLFIDINGLKKTNDQFGHEAGDELIKSVVDYLQQNLCRETDSLYRIGGDEFVIFMHKHKEKDFEEQVRRILQILDEKPMFSIGEVWIDHCVNLEEQIKIADALMYKRKAEYKKNNRY